MSRTVVFAFCVLSATAIQQIPERHSLYYVYTAMSKPVAAPGIFEFVAMGLLDDRQIDYYNSRDKVKVPKQDWMKERNTKDYWNKGTQSRRSKEQWFKVNINILMERMKQNNSDIHVLQWRHGCEIEPWADGKPKFMKGVDEYSYDGRDFLSFDDSNSQWVAPTSAAVPTKQKWDGVPILNQYTKGYLESECVDWLSKFMKYGEKELEMFAKDSSPRVYPLAKKTSSPDKLLLTCFATGFYPKDIILNIKKDNITLTKADGVQTGDVLPNDDNTHQLRKSVEIPESDKAEYECEVIHRSLEKPVIVKWDGSYATDQGPVSIPGIILGIIVVLIIIGLIVGIVIYKRRIIGKYADANGTGENAKTNGTESAQVVSHILAKGSGSDGSVQGTDSGHSSFAGLDSAGRDNPKDQDSASSQRSTDSGQDSAGSDETSNPLLHNEADNVS